MKITYFLIVLITIMISCKQTIKKEEDIKTDTTYLLLDGLLDQYIELNKCPTETVMDLDTFVLKLSVKDCKGKMSFILADKRSNRKIAGQYENGLDTLKKYSISKSAITGDQSRSILKYFQPIPTGTWFYFDDSGRIDTVIYKNGFRL